MKGCQDPCAKRRPDSKFLAISLFGVLVAFPLALLLLPPRASNGPERRTTGGEVQQLDSDSFFVDRERAVGPDGGAGTEEEETTTAGATLDGPVQQDVELRRLVLSGIHLALLYRRGDIADGVFIDRVLLPLRLRLPDAGLLLSKEFARLDSEEEKLAVLHIQAYLPDPTATQQFLDILYHSDKIYEFKCLALDGLCLANPTLAQKVVPGLLPGTSDDRLRTRMIIQLSAFAENPQVEAVLHSEFLRSRDAMEQIGILAGLSSSSRPSTKEFFRQVIWNPTLSVYVREAAVEYLQFMPDGAQGILADVARDIGLPESVRAAAVDRLTGDRGREK